MEFGHIPKDMPLDRGIRFAARMQFELAAEALRLDGFAPNRAVHAARVRMKAARALLRLVRPVLDPEAFKWENAFCRDLARRLADARDAHVMTQTLQTIEATLDPASEGAAGRGVARLRRSIESVAGHETADSDAAPFDELARELEAAAGRSEHWRFVRDVVEWDELAAGLAATYRQGRRTLRKAGRTGLPDDYHDGRKWVKYLLYQLGFVADVSGRHLARMRGWAKELGHVLGLAHDVEVLRLRARHQCAEIAGRSEAGVMRALLKAIDRRENRLLRQAHRLAERLYGDRTSAFRKRARRSFAKRARTPAASP